MINKNFTLDTLLDTWFTLFNNKDLGISVTLHYNLETSLKTDIKEETFLFENLDDLKESERFKMLKDMAVISFVDTMYYQHIESLKDRYPFRIALYQI